MTKHLPYYDNMTDDELSAAYSSVTEKIAIATGQELLDLENELVEIQEVIDCREEEDDSWDDIDYQEEYD